MLADESGDAVIRVDLVLRGRGGCSEGEADLDQQGLVLQARTLARPLEGRFPVECVQWCCHRSTSFLPVITGAELDGEGIDPGDIGVEGEKPYRGARRFFLARRRAYARRRLW